MFSMNDVMNIYAAMLTEQEMNAVAPTNRAFLFHFFSEAKKNGGLENQVGIKLTDSDISLLFSSNRNDGQQRKFSATKYNQFYNYFLNYPVFCTQIEEVLSNDLIHVEASAMRTQLEGVLNRVSGQIAYAERNPFLTKLISSTDTSRKDVLIKVFKWIIIESLTDYDLVKSRPSKDLYTVAENDIPALNESASSMIYSLLSKLQIKYISDPSLSFVAEIPDIESFHLIRRTLISSYTGEELILCGPSLCEALGQKEGTERNADLNDLIANYLNPASDPPQRQRKVTVMLTDPSIFQNAPGFTQPIEDVRTAVRTLISQTERFCLGNHSVHIYFLPLLDIDHCVMTDEFMLYRSTKIWTSQKDNKGSFLLFRRSDTSEYSAQQKYIQILKENATDIYAKTDLTPSDLTSPDPAKRFHAELRESLVGNPYNIVLHKLYQAQLSHYAITTWPPKSSPQDMCLPIANSSRIRIRSREELFQPANLLDDNTQRVLLPYIRQTENMLTHVIKTKYDSRRESGAIIIPSLDLGYPNNVQRLAGGFATGMFIHWECGTPLIPVDATVNVCSSSIFRLTHYSEELTSNFCTYLERLMQFASEQFGYSYSFTSGNHFLMIARDATDPDALYLIMHSSANELKNSFLGLYPVENNWYSKAIKTYHEGKRYLRYIKGNEAAYFIQNAHYMETYNTDLHRWLASQLNCEHEFGEQDLQMTKHHYYMPTDSSIAIGTFVEPPGADVPIFSNVGKPIYLFRIGEDNLTFKLPGKKGTWCLVPHGWGQQIDHVQSLHVERGSNGLSTLYLDSHAFPVNSRTRLGGDELKKSVRAFENGAEFLNRGKNALSGEIIRTFTPMFLYCSKCKGPVKGQTGE
ncbi:MAG TPA: hypothetical protein DCP68_06945 [Ruminococcus sp.]|nr:hypothetical protein [Ruminococcus sp.]